MLSELAVRRAIRNICLDSGFIQNALIVMAINLVSGQLDSHQ